MLPSDAHLISVDDHVIEHGNVWQDRLPAKYKEVGPRIVEVTGTTVDPLGNEHTGTQQTWELEGVRSPTIGLNAVAGKPKESIGLDPVRFDEMIPGCYDVKERVKDMDIDGVQAQLCFPSFPGFAGSTFMRVQDKDLAYECVKAWNDFILDEWCAYAPERFIPMVLVPWWDDVERCVAEVQRTAAKGAKAVSFTEAPHNLGLPSFHSDHWDRFLAATQDADMPLCLHFGSGGAPGVAPDANFAVAIALFGTNSAFAMTELLLSPVFHKFPQLRVALSEGGIGWMPWMVERIDYTWERHRHYTGCNPDVRPSELFRKHIFGCFIADEAGIQMRHTIGIDNIMFESDYPHSDCNWPNSRKMLAEVLIDVPDDEARKIAGLNARRVFNFYEGA
ncbi:MAG TPA: amidohydrolase family protein [Vicinamibacterales bacterium]|nr:amidohydrolase family protein [Vicinamibacterales bacterium]